jgi:hypothetical protein
MSLFNLPKSLATQTTDVTKMYYDKVHPRTPVENDPARSGTTRLSFQVPGNRFFHPGRSYVRIELQMDYKTLTDSDPATPSIYDSGEALAMGTCGHFFTNCAFKIGGTPVSRISNGIAEIDALKTRSTKNKTWLDGIGALTNNWEEDPVARAAKQYQDANIGISQEGLNKHWGTKFTFGAMEKDGTDTVITSSLTDVESFFLHPKPVDDTNQTTINADRFAAAYVAEEQIYIPSTVILAESRQMMRNIIKDGDTKQSQYQYDFTSAPDPIRGWDVSLPICETGFGPGIAYTGIDKENVGLANLNSFYQFTGTKDGKLASENLNSELAGYGGGSMFRLAGTTEKRSCFARKFIELNWQPPLGIFDIDHALPAGDYELELTWDPNWRREIISRFYDSGGEDAFDSHFSNIKVSRIEFHVMMLEGTQYSGDENYVLDLSEWTLTERDQTADESSRRESFDVAPTTDAIAIAVQLRRFAGAANTVEKSRFIIPCQIPYFTGQITTNPNLADIKTLQQEFLYRTLLFRNPHARRQDLLLKRLQINYAGQLKPYVDNLMLYTPQVSDTQQTGEATNFLTERYMLNTLQTGGYFDAGGPETFEEWLKRGPYYMFLWPKDGSNHDVRAHVTYEMPPGSYDNGDKVKGFNYKLLFFYRYRKGYGINVRNSRVTEIEEAANVAPAVMTS